MHRTARKRCALALKLVGETQFDAEVESHLQTMAPVRELGGNLQLATLGIMACYISGTLAPSFVVHSRVGFFSWSTGHKLHLESHWQLSCPFAYENRDVQACSPTSA